MMQLRNQTKRRSLISNLNIPRIINGRKRTVKKQEAPDYGLLAGDDDDLNEYGLPDLFDEGIQPKQNN